MPVDDKEVEYFFASDASAVIEHTNRVIYLEVCKKNNKKVIEIMKLNKNEMFQL